MHILTFTSLFPNASQPNHGIFVRNRMEAFVKKFGHTLTVVAPIVYFPKLPFKTIPKYDMLPDIPCFENTRGYPVWHPRYLITPKVGMRWYSQWMKWGVLGKIKEIHQKQPIDCIDAHYLYPDGVVATAIGEELNIPVILSARGTDMSVFPKIPSVSGQIQKSLNQCQQLICVSRSLKDLALTLGVPDSKISVIGNGVDTELFRISDKTKARNQLGLPQDRALFISVGHLNENKGFHLIIQAFARLENTNTHLVVVGNGPQRNELLSLIAHYHLQERVTLAGAILNSDLPTWYSTADIFVLASAREGWPNVVCEAQAMGLPVVATRVNGIPEIITEPWQGILIHNRDISSLHQAMSEALTLNWEKERIKQKGQARSWDTVSSELAKSFLV